MMKYRWLVVIVLFLGITVAAYFLRGIVSVYILTPFVIITRIGRILFKAFPQVVYWILFLVGGVILALSTLPVKKKASRSQVGYPNEKWESRAKQYSKWIASSDKSEYSRWMLVRQLSSLAFDLLMYQERLSVEEARHYLKRNVAGIPIPIRDYIQAGMAVPSFRHYTELVNNFEQNDQASPMDINPELVIEYLEYRIKQGGLD